MEQFLNKEYVQVSAENFDEFLTFTGVGYMARMAASTLKPVCSLTLNDDGSYTFSLKSLLLNTNATFRLGEEFEEKRGDGLVVNAIIVFEDNKMIHIQTDAKGRTYKHVREFFTDKMIVTTTAVGFDKIVTRRYQLVE